MLQVQCMEAQGLRMDLSVFVDAVDADKVSADLVVQVLKPGF